MSRMAARTSINNETDGIGAPKIWVTRLFQPGTVANRSSVDKISPLASVRSNLVTDQTNPNHAFLVGTIPHGKSRLRHHAERSFALGSQHHHTPFFLPIPNILCQASRMRNLTATICLSIAVLVGNMY
jgi:hypothetical protein